MSKVNKLYAAYKAGYLGNNILDTYFSFIANMIAEEHLSVVEDPIIATKWRERYAFDLPLPFIRQVLGVGVQNGCFIDNRGKYNLLAFYDRSPFAETVITKVNVSELDEKSVLALFAAVMHMERWDNGTIHTFYTSGKLLECLKRLSTL